MPFCVSRACADHRMNTTRDRLSFRGRRRRHSPRAGSMAPTEESSRPGQVARPSCTVSRLHRLSLRGVEKPSSAAGSPPCLGCLLPIAIGWMMCPASFRVRRHDRASSKKPRSRPLAGSGLATKDLWHPARSIRSASGRRVRSHPALPTSPRGFWGRCEPRRAEGALARPLPCPTMDSVSQHPLKMPARAEDRRRRSAPADRPLRRRRPPVRARTPRTRRDTPGRSAPPRGPPATRGPARPRGRSRPRPPRR
jgi:hypothetical protein